MLRGRQYIGVSVKDASGTERVGRVSDLVFDRRGHVTAVVIGLEKGLFHKEKVIPLRAFSQMSADGAVLEDFGALDRAETVPSGWRLSAGNDGLCGRRLVSEDGGDLGVVGDVVMGDDAGTVWGFEVSDGLVMDLLDGRPVIEARGAEVRGDDIFLTSGPYMNLTFPGHPSSEGSEDD